MAAPVLAAVTNRIILDEQFFVHATRELCERVGYLSLERLAPARHLAHGRSGARNRGAGSKASPQAPITGKTGDNEHAVASLARRSRPPLLARLPFQTRPALRGD